jgi:two-component system response regulator DevR
MKVFIVEDALKMRNELTDLVAKEEGLVLVGQAGSVQEALAGLEATLPEAVLLDISLPDGSGISVLKYIRQRGWDLRVVVLTSNPYDALRTKCRALGAAAVLDKLDGLDQVLETLLALSSLLESNNGFTPLLPAWENHRIHNNFSTWSCPS